MDRKITSIASIAPAPDGWRARISLPASGKSFATAETRTQEAQTLADLVAILPASAGRGAIIERHLKLPAHVLVFERLTLPSSDPQELAGMVRLQLEKTLPYPVEETTSGFQVLACKQTELPLPPPEEGVDKETAPQTITECTVFVCVVHNEAMGALCAPLLEKKQFPASVVPWAMQIAAQAPAEGISCAVWREESDTVFAIYENGVLGFVEVLPSSETVAEDLPHVLMSAELAGAPTDFIVVMLDPALSPHREPILDCLGAPTTEDLRLDALHDAIPKEAPVDLALDSWRADLARRKRLRTMQTRLAIAGAIYLLLLLVAGVGLMILGHRLKSIDTELNATRTRVEAVLAQQSRWKSLSPATDPDRFTVELLYQVFRSLPSADVRVTQFDQSPNDFRVQGEAPDAAQAVTLTERLRSQPALSGYQFEAGNPILLPNDHAQFSIAGKL